MDRLVALVQRVDAQAHDVEGVARGPRGLDAPVKVLQALDQLRRAVLVVGEALARHRELQARVGKLAVGRRGVAGGLVLVGRGLLQLLGELGRARRRLAGGAAVLLDGASGLGGLLRGRLALGRDLRLLAQGRCQLVLQAAAVGRGGLQLGREARLLALGGSGRRAGLCQGVLLLLGGLEGRRQGIGQLAHALLQRADASLALKRAALVGGRRAHVHAAVGQDRHAVQRDEGEVRPALVPAQGLAGVGHEPHVAEKGLKQAARVVAGAQAARQRDAGRPGGRGVLGAPRRAQDDARHALGTVKGQGALRDLLGTRDVGHDKGGQVVAQKPLEQGLHLGVGVDKVGQAALDKVLGQLVGQSGHDGARLLDLAVHRLQGGQGRLRARQLVARGRLGLLRGLERRLVRRDQRVLVLRLRAGRGQVLVDSRQLVLALGQRRLGRLDRLFQLLKARDEELVLDLEARDLLLELGVGKRLCVGFLLGGRLLGRQAVHLGRQLVSLGRARVRRLFELVHLGSQVSLAHPLVRKLAAHALVLGAGVVSLLLHRRELHAHLGEARNHVLALLLQQAHVGVHAAEKLLHAAALLAEVAHEQALLLEQALQLLELGGLLVVAVLGKLDGRLGLAAAGREAVVAVLEAPQVVDGELNRQLLELVVEVVRALGLVDLALQRLQLPADLARDHLGAREVLVHRRQLAHAALLAAAVLGDVGRLLDERAALLGPARQDRVELALADDRVRVLAQARVVQDVLDVHQARRSPVDQVLGLAGAVHAPGDADLGEVDRQRVVGVVEHQRDLGHAHRPARGRAREDDVFHGLAAQHLGALLAQDPQDRVRDVGLARAVGAHDDREARVEDHLGLICEGLESFER